MKTVTVQILRHQHQIRVRLRIVSVLDGMKTRQNCVHIYLLIRTSFMVSFLSAFLVTKISQLLYLFFSGVKFKTEQFPGITDLRYLRNVSYHSLYNDLI